MAWVRTGFLAMVLLAVAVSIMAIGARLDPAAIVANVVADVLIGVGIVFTIRRLSYGRERRQRRAELAVAREEVLKELREALQRQLDLLEWAGLPLELSEPIAFARYCDRPLWSPSCEDWLRRTVRTFAANYGAVELPPVTERVLDGHRDAAQRGEHAFRWLMDAWQGESGTSAHSDSPNAAFMPGTDEYKQRHTAIEAAESERSAIRSSLPAVIADTRLLVDALEQGYEPVLFVRRRHPDAMPAWIRALGWAALAVAALFWLATNRFPGRVPPRMDIDVALNLMAGMGTLLAGTAIAIVGHHTVRSRIRGEAALPYLNMSNAVIILCGLHEVDEPRRTALLKLVASAMRDGADQLLHVHPDARLASYAEEFNVEIAQTLAEPPLVPYRRVDPIMVTKFGWPADTRVPTPESMHLLELAQRLTRRAEEVYIDKVSWW